MPSEAQARITINTLLEEAGWRLMPKERESLIQYLETNVSLEKFEQAA